MSSGEGGGPRLIVTADDHRAIIVIVVVICAVWSLFVIAARAIWRLHQKSDFGLDDSVALLGTAISIAQAGVTLAGVGNGFGRREDALEPQQIQQAGKYLYAASLLYILGLCASRASMPLLIARLTRDRNQVRWTQVLLGIILAWGVGSTFGIAFECGTPVPWVSEARTTCSGLFVAWTVIESLGLLIEVLTLAMAFALVINLNMLVKFKIAVVGSFMLRGLLIIPVAFRLDLLRKITRATSTDPFFQTIDLTIVTQIILHYSLWAASFPCMRAFLRAFDTGMGVTTGVSTYKGSNHYASNSNKGSSFALRSLNTREVTNSQSKEVLRASPPASPASTKPPTTSGSMADPDTIDKVGAAGAGTSTTKVARSIADAEKKHNEETASQTSRKAIITRTVEWKIEHEELPGRAM